MKDLRSCLLACLTMAFRNSRYDLRIEVKHVSQSRSIHSVAERSKEGKVELGPRTCTLGTTGVERSIMVFIKLDW